MILVVAGICIRDNTVLLTRRPPGKHLAGYWEFPGGKIDPGESPETALIREFMEELAVDVQDIRPYTFAHHRYQTANGDQEILLLFYLCQVIGEPRAQEDNPVRWVKLTELDQIKLPDADRKLVAQLSQRPPHLATA